MNIEQSLYEGQHICLGPIDHEKDPEIEARWTNDACYLRMLSPDPARPRSAAQIKKKYEKIEKEQDEQHNQFYFAIRMRTDDRLIGFAQLPWIEWSNGAGFVVIGIGEAKDRLCGYGSEALGLVLRFVFAELNLYHLTANVAQYNEVALHVFKKAGFVEEVCRREALARDGRYWDMISLGILRPEWERSRV